MDFGDVIFLRVCTKACFGFTYAAKRPKTLMFSFATLLLKTCLSLEQRSYHRGKTKNYKSSYCDVQPILELNKLEIHLAENKHLST